MVGPVDRADGRPVGVGRRSLFIRLAAQGQTGGRGESGFISAMVRAAGLEPRANRGCGWTADRGGGLRSCLV